MNCKQLVEFLQQYRAGELPNEVRDELEAHLDRCQDCRRYLESYENTVRLGALAAKHPDDTPPREVPEDLLQAILAALDRAKKPTVTSD